MANSTFPNQVDVIKQWLDITQSDWELVKQYKQAKESGDFAQAEILLKQIPQYDQKIQNADRFNLMRDALLKIEQFYLTDIQPYVAIKQQEWENKINQFSYKQDYNPSTQYVKNNIVRYNNNGLISLYLNISDVITPIGTNPSNVTYFRQLTVRGLKGDGGIGANFSFDWNSGATYSTDTIIVYDNKWWIALQSSINQLPFDGSVYWSKVLEIKQATYPVQTSKPTGQNKGDIWFEVN